VRTVVDTIRALASAHMTKTGTLPENLYLGESERTAMRMLGQPIVHYPDPEDRFVTRHKWKCSTSWHRTISQSHDNHTVQLRHQGRREQHPRTDSR